MGLDLKAFDKMNSGVYLISSKSAEKAGGCVANTLTQVTVTPVQLVVALHKDNFTTHLIEESCVFTAVTLAQSAKMELIGAFGFSTSKEKDKFSAFQTKTDLNGVPYVCEQVVARTSCKVVKELDAGTHIVFLGEALESEIVDDVEPMSYAYYHTVKKGLTPPKASSYRPPKAVKGFRCKVCGYVYEGDTLPDSYICPICKRGTDVFEPVTE